MKITYTTNLFFILIIWGCSKDCQTTYFLDQVLENESLSFMSWENKDTLFFQDNLGNEFIYSLTICINDDQPYKIFEQCGSNNEYIGYNTERRLKRYTSANNTAIAYSQRVDFLMSEMNLEEINLVDRLTISTFNDLLFTGEPIDRIYLVTSSKSSEYNVNMENSKWINKYDSLELFDRKFYNVLSNNSNNIFYTKKEGVISFIDNQGNKLVLDHWN